MTFSKGMIIFTVLALGNHARGQDSIYESFENLEQIAPTVLPETGSSTIPGGEFSLSFSTLDDGPVVDTDSHYPLRDGSRYISWDGSTAGRLNLNLSESFSIGNSGETLYGAFALRVDSLAEEGNEVDIMTIGANGLDVIGFEVEDDKLQFAAMNGIEKTVVSTSGFEALSDDSWDDGQWRVLPFRVDRDSLGAVYYRLWLKELDGSTAVLFDGAPPAISLFAISPVTRMAFYSSINRPEAPSASISVDEIRLYRADQFSDDAAFLTAVSNDYHLPLPTSESWMIF